MYLAARLVVGGLIEPPRLVLVVAVGVAVLIVGHGCLLLLSLLHNVTWAHLYARVDPVVLESARLDRRRSSSVSTRFDAQGSSKCPCGLFLKGAALLLCWLVETICATEPKRQALRCPSCGASEHDAPFGSNNRTPCPRNRLLLSAAGSGFSHLLSRYSETRRS